MTELKSYSQPELEALAERIQAEIAKREREEEERARQAAEAERAAAEQAAREAAEAERHAKEEAARAAEAAHKIRYMHPSNRALTWSGIGATPDWVSAWLVTGGTLYALEVAAEKLAPKPIPDSLRPR